MENKKMVPEIRFSGFTDPWEQCELGEILKYEQPQAYIVDSTYYDDTYNTPVLTAGQSFILGYTNEIFGIKDASEDNPVIIFDDFTTSSHYVDFPFKIKSSAMKLLSLNNSDDDINCVFNAMQNISYVPVTHERHWISTFAKFNVLLPENKDEQKKIGIFFASIDNLITLHQRKLEKLKTFKKAMLDKMFPKNGELVPEIRFSGFTDPWEQRKLDDITDVRDGTHDSPQYLEVGHPFVTSKNVKDGFINYEDIQYISDQDFEEINKRSKVDKNDILMGMIGTIGNIALVREVPDFAIKNIALIKDIGDIFYHYLYHCLQSNSVVHQLDENLDGGTQKFIALNKIRELVIPVPSEYEQHKIGECMGLLDNIITLHQRKLEKLQNIKKSMLNKMFI